MAKKVKLFWNNLDLDDNNGINLSFYVEENKNKLRKKYLEKIKLISSEKLNQLSITQLSHISENFNLYESSLLEEKSIYKSKNIIFFLKVLALEMILNKDKSKEYEILGVEKENINIVEGVFYKFKKNVIFRFACNRNEESKIANKLYNRLPNLLKVTYQVIKNFLLIIILKKINIKNFQIEYLYFSNTYYFKYPFINNTKNENKLIGSFARTVKKNDKAIILCHCDKSYSNEKNTQKILLNSSDNFQLITLNSLLNIEILIKSFFIYINFYFFNFKIRKLKKKISKNINLINYFDLIKADWDSSFYGPVAFENIKIYLILKNFFSKVLVKKRCFYICENQGWEKMLIKSCKNFSNRNLFFVGIVNSAIRFWDFRYFFTISKKNISPDQVAINRNIKFDKKIFYNNFCKNVVKTKNIYSDFLKKSNKVNITLNKVLILGDITKYHNDIFLKFLSNSELFQVNFDFKSHPSSPVNLNKFTKLRIKNINSVKNKYRRTISIGATSALIEGSSFSKKTAVFLPPGSLNFFPETKKQIKKLYNAKDIKKFIL